MKPNEEKNKKNNVLEIRSLSFRYEKKTKQVLNHFDLSMRKGEILGLLGVNGAGKTTLIHMLSTLLKSFSGTVVVCGFDVLKEPGEVRRSIGALFQESILDNELSGYQTLDFYAKLNRVPNRKTEIVKLASFMGLKDELDKKVACYSGGMRRRLELARALLVKPKLMLLDEPTIGLDPLGRRKVWDYLKKLNQKYSTSMLITTHYADEADYLCDRIAIMDEGRIIALGAPSNLKAAYNINLVKIRLSPDSSRAMTWFRNKSWIKDIVHEDSEIKFILLNPKRNLELLLGFLNKLEPKIISFECNSLSLDDLFIRYVEKNKNRIIKE